MFEIQGLIYLKMIGYGWLWGKKHWRANRISGEDAWGNGGNLFAVGLFGTLAIMIVGAIALSMLAPK